MCASACVQLRVHVRAHVCAKFVCACCVHASSGEHNTDGCMLDDIWAGLTGIATLSNSNRLWHVSERVGATRMRMEEKQRKPSDPEDVCTYLNIVHTKYTCVCVQVCACVCMCVVVCMCVHAVCCVLVCASANVCACVCMCVHVCLCACLHVCACVLV